MTLSTYIPTPRGCLILIAVFIDGMIVPLFIPAYDGPGVSIFAGCIVVLLAAVTIVLCFRSLHKTRIPDKLAGLLAGGFSFWLFYVFTRRAA